MGNSIQTGLLSDIHKDVKIINDEITFENKDNKYKFYNKDGKDHQRADEIIKNLKIVESTIKNTAEILKPTGTPSPTTPSPTTPSPTTPSPTKPIASPTPTTPTPTKPSASPTPTISTFDNTTEYFTNTNDNCDWVNNYLNVALILLILGLIGHNMGYRIVKRF